MPVENQGHSPLPPKTTRLGPAVSIEGEIKGQEDAVIEGQVRGKIYFPTSDLLVTTHARLEAMIQAKNITIQGEVIGDIEASGHVTITQTGRMMGNISASVIRIEDGAQFKGAIKIRDKK